MVPRLPCLPGGESVRCSRVASMIVCIQLARQAVPLTAQARGSNTRRSDKWRTDLYPINPRSAELIQLVEAEWRIYASVI